MRQKSVFMYTLSILFVYIFYIVATPFKPYIYTFLLYDVYINGLSIEFNICGNFVITMTNYRLQIVSNR